ncbi:MAG: N-acetylmuramoyl-L-alanine amidase [Minisyncoccia bacterium]
MKYARKSIIIVFIFCVFGIGVWYLNKSSAFGVNFSDVEAEFENFDEQDLQQEDSLEVISESMQSPPADPILSQTFSTSTRRSRWAFWWKEFSPEEEQKYGKAKLPSSPIRVGIQAGHWKNNEVPDELSGLKRSGGGAIGGGKSEVDVVLEIAKRVKKILEERGVVVDLLPATIPIDYHAHAFVSIHADGNSNTSVSGFKIASPQTDFSQKSVLLVDSLNKSYKLETGLSQDDNITRRMSAYYAFNWRRYDHALHPMTPSVIVETGFMTSPSDRKIIVSSPDKVAKGIAYGILNFLNI